MNTDEHRWAEGLVDGELKLVLASFAEVHPVHKVPAYHFRMVHRDTGEDMGHVNLRVGHTTHVERYAGHIGYSVVEQHRRHRYAARAVRLLLPVARRMGLDPVWITCDPENMASRRTLEIAGAEFVEIVEVPADCVIFGSGHPRKCRYRLDLGSFSPTTQADESDSDGDRDGAAGFGNG